MQEDGCRQGAFCKFCHLCSEDRARHQKRSCQRKARAVKRAELRRAGAAFTVHSFIVNICEHK